MPTYRVDPEEYWRLRARLRDVEVCDGDAAALELEMRKRTDRIVQARARAVTLLAGQLAANGFAVLFQKIEHVME